MRFWLVPCRLRIPNGLIVSNSGFLICFYFSPFCWTGCFHAFWQVLSTGWGHTSSLVWDFRLTALQPGSLSRRGRRGWIYASCSGHNWPLLWWCKQWTGNSGEDFERGGQRGIACFSFWWLSHINRALQGISWEWLRKSFVDYPNFDVRLLKWCLQKTASVIFGTLDPFSMTEVIVTQLKGAEHRLWMQSRQSLLRMAIETGDLSLPGFLDVVSNIIGVWPLIVSYLKETGKKESGDSFVVWRFFLSFLFVYCPYLLMFSYLEERDRWILLRWPVGQNEVPSVPSYPWNVLVFKWSVIIE